jgi:hypothetical protein
MIAQERDKAIETASAEYCRDGWIAVPDDGIAQGLTERRSEFLPA